MAQSTKCLLCEHEELSLLRSAIAESQVWRCTSVAQCWGTEMSPGAHWVASLVWESSCLRSKPGGRKECTPTDLASGTHAHTKGRASMWVSAGLTCPWTGTSMSFLFKDVTLPWNLPDAIREFFCKKRQHFHSGPSTERLYWCAWNPVSINPEMEHSRSAWQHSKSLSY